MLYKILNTFPDGRTHWCTSFDHDSCEVITTIYDSRESADRDCDKFNGYARTMPHRGSYAVMMMADDFNPYIEMPAKQLKYIINRAVKKFDLPTEWSVPARKRKFVTQELISQIDEMCSEFGLTIGHCGDLKKS